MGTYNHSLSRITVIENSLNDIVSVTVSEQLLQSRSVEDLSNKSLSDFGVGNSDTLFNDIRRESVIS
jgi:hypothetical protein